MVKKITSVETYLIILFLFALLVAGLIHLGNEYLLNDNAAPDNDSIEYIATLNGINLTEYRQTQSELEKTVLVTGNESAGNPKDFALDFLMAKEKGFPIELTIKRIFNLPTFVIVDLFRLPINQWSWAINIFGWLLGIVVTIALINFVRNR